MQLVTLFGLVLLVTLAVGHEAADLKHYIVYMGQHSHPSSESVIMANHEMLASVLESYKGAKEAAIHHYTKSFRGFSARLTPDQATKLSENEGVVSVFESRMNQLHTTNSWRFLGVESLSQYNKPPADIKSDVIVGVIDTGIWPESESFSDYGLGPVPKKFKGECVPGQNFTRYNCNRKLIGAKYYSKGWEAINGRLEDSNLTFFRSPRDSEGHGSHTSSTIAGSMVSNASLYGLGSGTATGGVPSARLSIYKACWFKDCEDADILAAIDDAIHDGVDIISMSLGPIPPQTIFFEDAISIGTFHAFQKGIVVCASAGNSFLPRTATNVAPWILTVGASTINREFPSYILLGNLKQLKGFAVNTMPEQGKQYSLISGSVAAASGIPSRNASFCKRDTLDSDLIKGKIVVCTLEMLTDDRKEKAAAIKEGGGAGMILIDPLSKYVLFQPVIPSVLIGQAEALELQSYMNTEKNSTARIYLTVTHVGTKPAPAMAIFSSKGPNIITPDIIKPDITAPGVNILAAWSPVSTEDTAGRSINYNIISGTSMACPHIAAVAALLKSVHPYWSPATIKSAIMTTATTTDNTANLIKNDDSTTATPFDYGSGHINPAAAIDPGLIYDYDDNDIINFLCSYGASFAQLKNLTDTPVTCKNSSTPSYNFNYPSIGVANMAGKLSVYRTVTYMGQGPAVYYSKLELLTGVKASVYPNVLKFAKAGEKMTYRVDFIPYKSSNGSFVFGSLTWWNKIHSVRSPIAVNVVSI
uniref:subtilisin-like serine-protease S n=1 Tax=Erigeron canadensis TaxID=72917 RepID=UPI001CB9CC34|nr:subtilisin-like serine-protease S [Erigeron canadensis]